VVGVAASSKDGPIKNTEVLKEAEVNR